MATKGTRTGRLRRACSALAVSALLFAGCASADTKTISPSAAIDTPTTTEVRAGWVVVKYRDTPVNVARFAELRRTDSSLVFDAWYDVGNNYMVINLTGTNYHYCAFPRTAWDSLKNASSMGTHYNNSIRGNYDCRVESAAIDTLTTTEVRAGWVVVKYRDTPVNVTGFAELRRTDSSLVFDAWYDVGNNYMVINLTGTNYHYCAFPRTAWDSLKNASSMGTHYNNSIRGNYDCRVVGIIPDY